MNFRKLIENKLFQVFVVTVSLIPLFLVLSAPVQGDANWFFTATYNYLHNQIPYLNFGFEYPPYSFFTFILPMLGTYLTVGYNLKMFVLFLGIEVLIVEWIIRYFILRYGMKTWKSLYGYLPFILYSIAASFQTFYYLQRYDIFLAACIMLVALALYKEKYTAVGFILTFGILLKLSPIVFAPIVLWLAFSKHKIHEFLNGVGLGIIPALLISLQTPWWNFYSFHLTRGFQVESLYSSIIWFFHLLGGVKAHWALPNTSYEIQAPFLAGLKPYIIWLWVVAVLFSLYALLRYLRKKKEITLSVASFVCFLPLLAFIIFNTIFSPQYLMWLMPLAALMFEMSIVPLIIVTVCAILTSFIFPSHEYFTTGLHLPLATMLLIRNLLLVALWIYLLVKALVYNTKHEVEKH